MESSLDRSERRRVSRRSSLRGVSLPAGSAIGFQPLFRVAVLLGGIALSSGAVILVGCTPTGGHGSATIRELRCFGGPGRGVGALHQPRGIELLPDESCVVIDRTGRVQRFDREGEVIAAWQLPQWSAGQPIDLTLTPSGTLVVGDTHYARLLEYDPNGPLLRIMLDGWIPPGETSGLALVRGVAAGADGALYVADYGASDRVFHFDRDGAYLGSFGRKGDGEFDFIRPEGVTIGTGGDVFVVDCGHHRILRFTASGEAKGSFGTAGSEPGQFLYPFDIATGSEDCLYVVEFRGNRVQRFDAEGHFLDAMGAPGRAPGEFATPRGIAVLPRPDADLVVVADTNNHRVQRFRWGR
ncbi:MAG: hypothetical protein KDC38_02810 [Planctomycetes bacterium]|nr:hypothetical protein [Planctomycetota bacterium]